MRSCRTMACRLSMSERNFPEGCYPLGCHVLRPAMVSSLFLMVCSIVLCLTAPVTTQAGDAGAAPSYILEKAPPEPADYRLKDYRAPTPSGLTGATTVSSEEAMALWKSRSALFIDVLPRPVRPDKLPADTIWHPPERRDIPGSVWLPNTGYGVLSAAMKDYFAENLARLTKENREQPILIYCLENCWMSWNAAKRALTLGYRKVYWYPAGTDGWERIGGRLKSAEPVPTGRQAPHANN